MNIDFEKLKSFCNQICRNYIPKSKCVQTVCNFLQQTNLQNLYIGFIGFHNIYNKIEVSHVIVIDKSNNILADSLQNNYKKANDYKNEPFANIFIAKIPVEIMLEHYKNSTFNIKDFTFFI